MSTVKVKFRPSATDDRQGTVYYQISHERSMRCLSTDYRLFPGEWDHATGTVGIIRDSPRYSHLCSVRDGIMKDCERIGRIIRRLAATGLPYDAGDIIESYRLYTSRCSLFNYMQSAIDRLRLNGKYNTAGNYLSTLNSFKAFRQGNDIMLDCLTPRVMEEYEVWLHGRGLSPNTSSFYMRIVRALYNRGVEEGIVDSSNIFSRVYTGVGKTVKRAIPLDAIRSLKHIDLSPKPHLDYARDMFMLSFYLRGMSFVDMAYLRKTDLHSGTLTYRRRKTNQLLSIAWTHEMQDILNKYAVNPTTYLLPILTTASAASPGAYRSTLHSINLNLKKIATLIGITIPLSMYVARHSWASAAKTKGIPTHVISEGMGHDSETTTRIYLASLETSVIDKANALIMGSL